MTEFPEFRASLPAGESEYVMDPVSSHSSTDFNPSDYVLLTTGISCMGVGVGMIVVAYTPWWMWLCWGLVLLGMITVFLEISRLVEDRGIVAFVPSGVHHFLTEASAWDIIQLIKQSRTYFLLTRFMTILFFNLTESEKRMLLQGLAPKVNSALRGRGLLRALPKSIQDRYYPHGRSVSVEALEETSESSPRAPDFPAALLRFGTDYKRMSEASRRRLYGLLMQSLHGDCSAPEPPVISNRHGWWREWVGLKGLSSELAKKRFVAGLAEEKPMTVFASDDEPAPIFVIWIRLVLTRCLYYYLDPRQLFSRTTVARVLSLALAAFVLKKRRTLGLKRHPKTALLAGLVLLLLTTASFGGGRLRQWGAMRR